MALRSSDTKRRTLRRNQRLRRVSSQNRALSNGDKLATKFSQSQRRTQRRRNRRAAWETIDEDIAQSGARQAQTSGHVSARNLPTSTQISKHRVTEPAEISGNRFSLPSGAGLPMPTKLGSKRARQRRKGRQAVRTTSLEDHDLNQGLDNLKFDNHSKEESGNAEGGALKFGSAKI